MLEKIETKTSVHIAGRQDIGAKGVTEVDFDTSVYPSLLSLISASISPTARRAAPEMCKFPSDHFVWVITAPTTGRMLHLGTSTGLGIYGEFAIRNRPSC
jgi:hypothetical protein